MTLLSTVILPGILVALFLAALLVMAVLVTRRYLGLLAEQRRAARIPAVRYQALRDLARAQGDVIASVIAELESRRATYETFPPDVRDALYAAHDNAGKTEREIA